MVYERLGGVYMFMVTDASRWSFRYTEKWPSRRHYALVSYATDVVGRPYFNDIQSSSSSTLARLGSLASLSCNPYPLLDEEL